MKTPIEEHEKIKEILNHGLQAGLISPQEMEEGLKAVEWEELQPILDKAQGLSSSHEEACERLRLARAAHPLHASDFSSEELEKLKVLAPEEYEVLK